MELVNDFGKAMRILLNPKSEKWLPQAALVAGEGVCLALIFGVTADAIVRTTQNIAALPEAAYLMAMSGLFMHIGRRTLALIANAPK